MRKALPNAVIAASLALLGAGHLGYLPWLWVAPGIVVAMLVLWPIAVAYAHTGWPLSVIALEVLPAEAVTRPASDEWARSTAARLAVHGFIPRARYRAPGSQFIDFGQRLDNDLTGEVALLAAGPPSPGGEAPNGLRTVTFFTRFTDGGVLATTNSPLPAVTPDLPGDVGHRLPDVTDVDQLYTAHRRLLKADGRRIKPILLGDAPVAWEREGNDRSIGIQVARGLAVRDEKAGVLCPTLKGAIRTAWLLHPWLTGLHRRRHAAHARAALANASWRRVTPPGPALAS